MRHILEEYGEAIAGVLAALVIMAIAVALFTNGGFIHEIFSKIANNAI